jgi:hypothetical protein
MFESNVCLDLILCACRCRARSHVEHDIVEVMVPGIHSVCADVGVGILIAVELTHPLGITGQLPGHPSWIIVGGNVIDGLP